MVNSLVTGGAGFIGSHLVDALLSRGDAVRVLDDFSTGKLDHLVDVQDRIELIEGDLRDPTISRTALQDVDLVFHQAAFVSVPQSLEQPDDCLEINVSGTRQLLEYCRQAGVARVVLASSAAVYGENTQIPLPESAQPDPRSPYAASKLITEILARLFTDQLDLEVVALRYFNVYGPRQNPNSDYAAVIPIFIQRLLSGNQPIVHGDGGQSRDFIFVEDVVRANLLAAEGNGAAGKVLNICSGKETNLLTLLSILASIFKQEIEPVFQEPRPGDIYRSLGDPSLAKQVLGFTPQTQFERGIQQTVAWMKGSASE